MRRHAFLILAHAEFEVLKLLLASLDDFRNDIFIHFDKKVSNIPSIKLDKARVFILEERIDVRWGDVSMLSAEYVLFEKARSVGCYAYYHLLSGVDMCLKSMDYFHRFFLNHDGKEFVGYSQGETQIELKRKVGLYHLFPHHFRGESTVLGIAKRVIRAAALRLQLLCGVDRCRGEVLKKGPQWVSVTESFVEYLLLMKEKQLARYRYTFCSDEIFVQTLCWNSPFKDHIYDASNALNGCLRAIRWKNNGIIPWHLQDVEDLVSSNSLFARKFSNDDKEILYHLGELNKLK